MKKTRIAGIAILALCVLLILAACGGAVQFKLNFIVDGEVYATIDTSGNEAIKLPENPTKEGDTFDGWYWDKDAWQKPFTANSLLDAPLSSDMNIYAKWESDKATELEGTAIKQLQTVTVTFNSNGGSDVATQSVKKGEKASKPQNPEKTGYTFAGWTYQGQDWSFIGYSVTENITLDASWTPINYPIIYNLNGGDGSNAVSYSIETENFTLQDANKNGYEFLGWTWEGQSEPTKNVTIPKGSCGEKIFTANWSEPIVYSITYDLAGGTLEKNPNPTKYTVESAKITIIGTPTRTGYNFAGWSTSSIPHGSTNNKTVTARWTPIVYTITYNLNGGNNAASNPKTYTIESNTINFASPTRTGYTFAGWSQTAIAKGSYGNKTVTASWVPTTYTITYNLKGGTNAASNPSNYTIETETITFAAPSRTGYTFAGWSQASIAKGSYGNKTVTARWTPIVYTVTYHLNGGTNATANPATYTIENGNITLANPTRTGYTFGGWYENEELTTKISTIQTSRLEKVDLYAKWTVNTYTITYTNTDSSGAYTSGSTKTQTVTYDSGFTLLPAQELLGNTFRGWYYGEQQVTSGIWQIPNNVTLTAKWEEDSALAPFTYILTATTCEITEAKDNTVTVLVVPDYVTSISAGAFKSCSGLESITVASGNPIYHSAGNCLIESESKTLILGCKNSVIPIDGSVTSIRDFAFSGCSGLKSIAIPNSVTSIGEDAFSGCSGLESMTIPFVGAKAGVTASDTYQYPFGYIFGTSSYTGGTATKQYYYGSSTSSKTNNTYYIPTSLKSVTVTGGNILVGAFYGCSGLSSITIPNSVTSIGGSAFYNCSGLTSIEIPNSVESIGDYAFNGCSGLTSITIPFVGTTKSGTSKTHFGYIFGATSYSDNSSYVPSSLKTVIITGGTRIGDYAFQYCSKLTSIEIPNSVTSIGSYAFSGCSGLTSIEIPNSVTSIGERVFYYCSGLGSITVESENPNYHSNGNCLIGTTSKALVLGCKNSVIPVDGSVTIIGNDAFCGCSRLTSIEIPNSVTSIGGYAFSGCSGLTSIEIPNSVTSIGDYAFSGCSGLTSIEIPNSVTSIGDYAFSGCSGLTSVTIENGVKSIGDYAFQYCSKLTSVTIPNSVTSIGSVVFYYCNKLTSITIPFVDTYFGYHFVKMSSGENANSNYVPSSLKTVIITTGGSIRARAFYGCSGLTSVTIENGVKSIGDYAFYGCSGLTSVTIENGVKSIGHYAFQYCSKLTSVTVPNSVTSIGGYAFSGCSGLESITIPFVGAKAGVTSSNLDQLPLGVIFGTSRYTGGTATTQTYYASSTSPTFSQTFYIPTSLKSVTVTGGNILYGAFDGCSGLTSVTIGNGVTSIGNYAFFGCSGLTSVTIGNSVTSIGNYAFCNCGGLTSIEIPNSVTSIGNYAFCNCGGLTSIEIPNSVTSIGNYAFSGCGGLESITVDEKNPNYCSVDGILYNKSKTQFIHIPNAIQGNITIPNGVTSIGSSAFSYCSGLTSVTIGNSVTSIGEYAFQDCIRLTSVTIGNSVKSIGKRAFYGCSGLTSVTIGNSVTSIGEYAFLDCIRLTSIEIPNGVTSIGDYAFSGCGGLESITVDEKNPNYCSVDGILYNKSKTQFIHIPKAIQGNISIPNSMTSIEASAFSGCSGLTSVMIPSSVTSIGSSAFYNCSGLTSITIPNSVTSIGSYAFSGCSGLTSVTFATPIGWYRNEKNNTTGGTNITVTDAYTNATNLSSKYRSYYWYRK